MSDAPTNESTKRRRGTVYRAVMLGFFVILMGAWLIRALYDTPRIPDNWTNGYSASPGGHRAFLELMRRNGYEVQQDISVVKGIGGSESGNALFAILEPRPKYVAEESEALERAIDAVDDDRDVLLVLPKRWYRQTHAEEGQGISDDAIVLEENMLTEWEVERVLEYAGFGDDLKLHRHDDEAGLQDGTGRYFTPLERGKSKLQYFEPGEDFGEYATLVETSHGEPVAIEIEHNDGKLILVADPDILTNRFIGEGNSATLALNIVEASGYHRVVVDESLHGFVSDTSIEYLAATPPGLWLTLSVMLLLALFAWREAAIFRQADDDSEQRRSRAFVIEGTARLMARARDYRTAIVRIRERAGRVLGALKGTGGLIAHGKESRELRALKRYESMGPRGVILAARDVSEMMDGEKHGRSGTAH
ncbi:MAG: hypothetical protein HUU29_02550 [Planctomycetaceae bacterium]|nr:hypothetical protein [Planctomycetaceae bacterium]